MAAKGWQHADVVRVSGQSSSVVSQWRGVGNGKIIKSIGKIEAAQRLEAASGYAALWIAKGEGPKMAPPPPVAEPLHPMIAQIVAWTKAMSPDQLMRLYATAHNMVNSTAAQTAPTPAPLPR